MAVTGSFHGRERFDPLLILAQIVLLQACFYISYVALLVVFQRATGTTAPLTDQILDYERITLAHFPGWVTSTALVLSAVGPTSLAFVAVVGRSRRALDFAATLLVSHLIATTVHSRFPTTFIWWALNIVAAAGLAAVAEAISLRLELRDIAVSREVKRGPPRDEEEERNLHSIQDVEAQDGNTDAHPSDNIPSE